MTRSSRAALLSLALIVLVAGVIACKKKGPAEPAMANVTFQIDQASCGSVNSSPIVDVFVDGVNVGTVYNIDTPNSRLVRQVTVGSHTLQATGSRGASYPSTVVDVPEAGYTVTLICTVALTANVVFQIQQSSCGTTHSSPIVDVFIDGANVGTIYNVDTPNSRLTFPVTLGNHTLSATGSRGASYPATVVNVTISGFTVPLVCTS